MGQKTQATDLEKKGIDDMEHNAYCRVHKPGVPRGSASTPGLGPRKQHVVRGPAQEPKTQWAGGIVRSPTGRSTQKQALAHQPLRPTSLTGAFALGTSRLRAVSPIGKAWPKAPLPIPTPRLRPGTP